MRLITHLKPFLYGTGVGLILCGILLLTNLPKAQLAKNFVAIKEVIALATTRKPETFTELYFEDHINLPKTITRWQQYTFSFTIHNLENRDMEYPYIVYLQRDLQKIIIYQGSVYVKNNEFKSIENTIGPLKNLRSKIVVELVDKNQIIDFWMESK